MPIGSMTSFNAGDPASLATMQGNVALVEAYIQGEIDPDDFQDKLKRIHGLRGGHTRVYGESWDSGVLPFGPISVSDVNADVWYLDRDAHLDFTSYGKVENTWNGVTDEYDIDAIGLVSKFVWEKLGNEPTENADGTGNKIITSPYSWRNWLFGLTSAPHANAGKDYSARFPDDEYWDRWLTVPYASKRIYIPAKCVLHVVGSATGTWNHNLNPFLERGASTTPLGKGWSEADGYAPDNENGARFRLFIDKDNDPEWRKFSWQVNGNTWYSNWSPIQSHPRVGYGGTGDPAGDQGKMLGKEWAFTVAPRGTALVASEIVVPEAGWYNISMRYNSRYVFGYTDVEAVWKNRFLGETGTAWRPGPICFSRWEKTGIGAVAQLKRSSVIATSEDVEFGL